MGIFNKIWNFLVGSNDIEVYRGNKGGYSYLLFWDKTRKEVMSQFVSPPIKTVKNVAGGGEYGGLGLGVQVNYGSETSYGEPFVVMNKNRTSQISEGDLTAKINEFRMTQNQKEIKPTAIYELEADKSFIAGSYMAPVVHTSIENPTFEAHFGELPKHIEDALTMCAEFVVKNFWGDQEIYRSSIFLHNALEKELKMRVAYNMSGYPDYMLKLKDGTGTAGAAFNKKRPMIADFNILKHEDYEVDSSKIWADMKSLLAVPILDSGNTPLGVLGVDTNKNYVEAKFDNANIQMLLLMLTRGIGRLLEEYAI